MFLFFLYVRTYSNLSSNQCANLLLPVRSDGPNYNKETHVLISWNYPSATQPQQRTVRSQASIQLMLLVPIRRDTEAHRSHSLHTWRFVFVSSEMEAGRPQPKHRSKHWPPVNFKRSEDHWRREEKRSVLFLKPCTRLSLWPLSIPPIFHPFLHPCPSSSQPTHSPPFLCLFCLFSVSTLSKKTTKKASPLFFIWHSSYSHLCSSAADYILVMDNHCLPPCVCVHFCKWQQSDGLCQWQHMACVSDTETIYSVMCLTVCEASLDSACDWLTVIVHSLLSAALPVGGFHFPRFWLIMKC